MDATTALIGLAIFIVSAIVVYIISVFGTKEKTYEEAIAEQRRNRLSEQLVLHPREDKAQKDKNKTKSKPPVKNKSGNSTAGSREALSVAKTSSAPQENSLHREKSEDKLKSKASKEVVKPKQEAPKPAAPNAAPKRERSVPNLEQAPAENHKVSKTKSEGNLRQTSGKLEHRESVTKIEVKSSKEAAKSNSKESNHTKKQQQQEESVSRKQYDSQVTASPSKKVSKSKSKTDILLVSGDQLVNMSQFVSQLKETVLTGEEIQNLIEVLLNKQQGDGNEWLQKGQKQDTVTLLKKRVADLEEQIQEQTSLAASATARVKEIRNESNQDKTRSSKTEKELRDRLSRQDVDVSNLTSNLKLSRDQHAADVAELQEKIKLYGSKLNDTSAVQKLQEQIAALEQQLAKAETEKGNFASAELTQLRKDNDDLRTARQSLEAQLATLKANEQAAAAQVLQLEQRIQGIESGKNEDGDRKAGQIATLESQAKTLQAENAKLNERLKIEENASKGMPNLRKDLAEFTSKLAAVSGQKTTLETEVQKLLGDLQSVRSKLQEQEIAINVASEEKVALMGRLSELEESVKQVRQNGDINNGHSTTNQQQLDELEATNAQLRSTVAEKEKLLKVLTDEAASQKATVQRLQADLEAKAAAIKNFNYDMDSKLQQLEDLKLECSQRRGECDRLRADVEAERQDACRKVDVAREEEKVASRELLKRLSSPFFEIDDSGFSSHSLWLGEYERRSRDLMERGNAPPPPAAPKADDELAKRLTAAEETNSGLATEVEHYKTVMAETESILSKLQSSVEEEESAWRSKLESKDEELTRVRGEVRVLADEKSALEESLEQIKAAEEMQQKLRELQAKLQSEENDRRLLESKHAKEIERLECDISTEKDAGRELRSQNVKLNSLVQIGKDSLRAEQELVKDLQVKLEATMNAAANGFPKEPNAVEHVESSYESKSVSATETPPSDKTPTATAAKKHKRKSKRTVSEKQ